MKVPPRILLARYYLKETSTKVYIRMTRKADLEFIDGVMAQFMRDNLKMI